MASQCVHQHLVSGHRIGNGAGIGEQGTPEWGPPGSGGIQGGTSEVDVMSIVVSGAVALCPGPQHLVGVSGERRQNFCGLSGCRP